VTDEVVDSMASFCKQLHEAAVSRAHEATRIYSASTRFLTYDIRNHAPAMIRAPHVHAPTPGVTWEERESFLYPHISKK
jgi:hypothetical protein